MKTTNYKTYKCNGFTLNYYSKSYIQDGVYYGEYIVAYCNGSRIVERSTSEKRGLYEIICRLSDEERCRTTDAYIRENAARMGVAPYIVEKHIKEVQKKNVRAAVPAPKLDLTAADIALYDYALGGAPVDGYTIGDAAAVLKLMKKEGITPAAVERARKKMKKQQPAAAPVEEAAPVQDAAPVEEAAPVQDAAPAPVKKQKQFAAWRGAVVEVLEIEDNGDAVIKFKGGALTTTPADNLEPTTAKKTALPDWLTVGAVIDIHSAMNPDQAPSRHTVESIGTTTVYYTDGYKSMINYLMHYGEPVPQAAAASLPLPFLAVCPEVSTAAEPVADAAADVVEAPAEPVADAAADVVEAPAAPLPGWCKDNTTVFNTLYNCKGIIKDFTYNKLFESWQCTFINTATGTEYKKHSISYMEPVEEAPAAVEEAAPVQDAAAVEEAAPAPAPALTDADVLARAARIRAAYDDMTAQAAAEPVADAITAYCAALEEPDAPAPAPVHRHPAILPRLGRWLRAAACLLPVLLAVLMLAASSPAANDAAAPTLHQAAADAVALVVELPAVTVTADAPTPAPSPVKKLAATPSVKNAAAPAVTPSNEKTADALATTPAPAADDADSLTTAPTVPTPDASPSDGLTICDGTAWAYTMMNWA